MLENNDPRKHLISSLPDFCSYTYTIVNLVNSYYVSLPLALPANSVFSEYILPSSSLEIFHSF
jgi:hypothetical protein